MKTITKLSLLLVFAAASRMEAAFESAQFDPANVLPAFPSGLQIQGITRGDVFVALGVTAEGRVSDSLVLGYTQESLATAVRGVVNQWRFAPARLDGAPVPAQFTMRVAFTLQGAVVSGDIVNHFFFDNFERMGDGYLRYRLHAADEIDRVPGRVNTVAPKYARQAEQEGVRGRVRVYFYIDEEGRVRLPAVDSELQPYLTEQAVAAVREWRFEPPTRGGQPVLIAASEEFDFSSAK